MVTLDGGHEFRYVAPQGAADADRVTLSQRVLLYAIFHEYALVRRKYPQTGLGPEEWLRIADLEPVSDEFGTSGRVKALLAFGDKLIAQRQVEAAAAVYGRAVELDPENDDAQKLYAFSLAALQPSAV